jgi:chromosome segregation ATPase
MGEMTERWRITHNWLAKFGDDLLALRDAFRAAADAENAIANADAALQELATANRNLTAENDTVAKRLAEQKLYLQGAEKETAARRASIDAEITDYRASQQVIADQEVIQAAADTKRKIETELAQLKADHANRTANRDALEEEVRVLMEQGQTLDRMNAEKTERLRKVEAKLADAGKFALGGAP